LFVEAKVDHPSIGWHNAPRRQFVVLLEGKEEIEIGDGTKRQFGPGDILLVEDTTGRGHKVRIIDDQFWKHFDVALE
jgi:quercetin dioxygenase-like cupin family protein